MTQSGHSDRQLLAQVKARQQLQKHRFAEEQNLLSCSPEFERV